MTVASFVRSGSVSVFCAVLLACPVDALARQSEATQRQRSRLAEQVNALGVGAEVNAELAVSTPGETEHSVRGKISAISLTGFELEIGPGRMRQFTYYSGEVRQVRLVGVRERHRVSWNELLAAVGHRKVALSLPSGTRVEGTIAAVRPNDLLLDVSKTTDSQTAPKGQLSIPRASISELTVKGSKTGSVVGGVVGGLLGIPVFVGASIAANETGSGASGLEFLWIAAAAVGGILIGSLMNRPDRTIVVADSVP